MYSYDRRTASSKDSILRLILRGVQNGRSTKSLVQAYIDEVIEDLGGEPSELSLQERDKWFEDDVDVLLSDSDVERVLTDTFVRVYMSQVPWANRQTALGVFDHPEGFPERHIPKAVAVAVAHQMALQDAADAHALRDLALTRG